MTIVTIQHEGLCLSHFCSLRPDSPSRAKQAASVHRFYCLGTARSTINRPPDEQLATERNVSVGARACTHAATPGARGLRSVVQRSYAPPRALAGPAFGPPWLDTQAPHAALLRAPPATALIVSPASSCMGLPCTSAARAHPRWACNAASLLHTAAALPPHLPASPGINSTCSWRRTSCQKAKSPVAAAPRPPPKQQPRAARPMRTAKQQPALQEQRPARRQQLQRQHRQQTALHQAGRPMASRSATSVAARATRGTAASSPSASAASSSGTWPASATARAGSAGP